jgi:hypothetical protein
VGYDPNHLAGGLTLPHIAQYVSIIRERVPDPIAAKELYLKFVKSWLFELAEAGGRPQAILDELDEEFDTINLTSLAERLGIPDFKRGANDPLLVLADFSLPIYLTTGHHAYIEMALKRTGKAPRTVLCPWREGIDPRPFYFDAQNRPVFDDTHRPSPTEPLVYHLHGFDQVPPSLVLSEDDYLEFLVAISRDKGRNTDIIPKTVREALIESSLLLLGYHLRSWDFRAIFWSLIKSDIKRNYKSVSVQLEPDEVDEKYLQAYLNQADFDVYRGSIYDYVQELRREVAG